MNMNFGTMKQMSDILLPDNFPFWNGKPEKIDSVTDLIFRLQQYEKFSNLDIRAKSEYSFSISDFVSMDDLIAELQAIKDLAPEQKLMIESSMTYYEEYAENNTFVKVKLNPMLFQHLENLRQSSMEYIKARFDHNLAHWKEEYSQEKYNGMPIQDWLKDVEDRMNNLVQKNKPVDEPVNKKSRTPKIK